MAKIELRDVPAYTSVWRITNVVKNPKRPGSKCYQAFEHFFHANTVEEFAKLHGKGYRSEIEWCAARGYITLMDPADLETKEEAEVEIAE